MKQGRHRFVVGDALGIGAFYDAAQFVGQFHFTFLHHFVVADDVQLYVGGNYGNAVYLIVAEELIRYFDDTLCSQLLAFEVETDSNVVVHLFQSQQ